MSIETYQFNLPITPGSIPPVLHLSQYDSGRTFTAILRDDQGVPFELAASSTAVIKGRNAAGIAWQQDCTVSGANVTFTPSGAATDQFGVMPVTIEITESEEIISPLCVVFHIQKAGYTNEEAVLSPDFETAIQAAVAQAISEGGLGFSDEFKEALSACFNGVAWATDGGQALVDDLEAALYPDVHLVSITAAYDQDHPIYNTDTWEDACATIALDLAVTAHLSDGTDEVLSASDYTLTGTLAVGTITVTVGYEGKTAEISVVVLDGTLLFEISNHTVDKTDHDCVNTQVKIMDEDRDYTILFDGTQPSAIPTGNNVRLMICWDSTNYKGMQVGTNSSGSYYGMEYQTGGLSSSNCPFLRNASSARFRFAFVHTKSSGTCTIYAKLNSDSLVSNTITSAWVNRDANVYFGGYGTSSRTGNWIGTISSAKIYSRVLSQDELNAFFG